MALTLKTRNRRNTMINEPTSSTTPLKTTSMRKLAVMTVASRQ